MKQQLPEKQGALEASEANTIHVQRLKLNMFNVSPPRSSYYTPVKVALHFVCIANACKPRHEEPRLPSFWLLHFL